MRGMINICKKSALIIGLSIIIGCGILGYSAKATYNNDIVETRHSNDVMTLSEVAQFLKLSESDVKGIIIAEQSRLRKTKHFSGMMFPYFKINDNYYFYKQKINEWLIEASIDRREYDTINYTILK